MRRPITIFYSILLTLGAALAPVAAAQEKFEAVLSGHIVIPAMTVIDLPEDAPEHIQVTGKYTHSDSKRRDAPGVIAGKDHGKPRVTDIVLPMEGQPFQGFSGITMLEDGTALIVTDNGFGTAKNSPDAMLMFHVVDFDWENNKAKVIKTTYLSDPDRLLPFKITNEAASKRYLTGADIDPESIQIIGGSVYIGDEFGPFIIRTDLEGKLTGFRELDVNGKVLRSPDHYTFQSLPVPGVVTFDVRKSRGFESMAVSPDGKYLYPVIEAPMWDDEAKSFENRGGEYFVRIYEFDVGKGAFTGRSFKYALVDKGNSVTEFNLIDARTGLVVERDAGEGDAALACGDNKTGLCFDAPAKFKRIYRVDLGDADADGFVKKVAYIDLLDIKDPNGLSRLESKGPVFTFPFETTESVDVFDDRRIIASNDNNFAFSSGRVPGKNDDNEFILLEVGDFLK